MRKLFMATALAAAATTVPATAGELLANGDFETGTYAGWTASVQTGSNGGLDVDDVGSTTPRGGFSTAPNASGGEYYSVSNQNGPGAYALSQGFVVPVGTTGLTFSFQHFANNYGNPVTINPAGLDYTASPNQHARVDLLVAGADPFSTDPADVLANFFLGADGVAGNPNPFASYSFDLTGLVTAGQSYVIRFGEVDNQGFFNQGVDNVSVFAELGAVPEPATWAMMIGGVGLVGGSLRRRARLTRIALA